MTERNQCDGCAIGATDSGYADAFYAIASAMGIGARSESPKHVFETEMLPRIRELVAGAAAPDEGEARGIEKAARWVDRRRDEYEDEHGTVDPETGSLEFGRGPSGQAKQDYVETLWEIAEGIRALSAPKGEAATPSSQGGQP